MAERRLVLTEEEWQSMQGGFSPKGKNRLKSIVDALEKDFRASKDIDSALEFWTELLERIHVKEWARRRDSSD